MAFRSERGRSWGQYPRRGESHSYRDPLDRGQDDRESYEDDEIPDQDADYARPSGRRHWRGHDDDPNEKFERGRSYRRYGDEPERALGAEHRYRFLRRDAEPRSRLPQQWREESSFGDERWSGPYAGRGPKGYRRSDERIYEEVCERLTEHPSIDASDIEVAVHDGDITLTGTVESRAVKHLTESMVETVPGVKEVHNQLRVTSPEQGASFQAPEERSELRTREAVAPKPRRR